MRENKLPKALVMFAIVVMGIFVAYDVPKEELKDILVTLAQLNVAIAVGIGALSIGYVKERKVQSRLTEVTIAIAAFSLLTFLIAHIDLFLWMNRIYLVINVLVICAALIITLIVTDKDKE